MGINHLQVRGMILQVVGPRNPTAEVFPNCWVRWVEKMEEKKPPGNLEDDEELGSLFMASGLTRPLFLLRFQRFVSPLEQ